MASKDKQALDDRGLIRWQMLLGSGLITFGALSIPLFQVSGVLQGQAATAAFAVATGVIGAGAAMLPTGAAAGRAAASCDRFPTTARWPAASAAPPTAKSTRSGVPPGGVGSKASTA
jgi:hypothetical protein